MKNRKVLVYLFMVAVFGIALFMLLRTNTQSFRRLNASVSPEEEKNIIIETAKKYIEDNIYKFDGKSEIALKDLIVNKYLSEEDTKEVTKDLYDENTRIFFTVSNEELTDIYLKSELFNKLFKCIDVCYIDENNYIYYDNNLYRILKADGNGNVYLVNNELESINADQVDRILKNKLNGLDKNMSETIDLISPNDIKESKFINIDKNVLVSSNIGYKVYDITNNELYDADTNSTYTMYVIKLLNTVNYELGDGSKFNPYVVSE